MLMQNQSLTLPVMGGAIIFAEKYRIETQKNPQEVGLRIPCKLFYVCQDLVGTHQTILGAHV